MMRFVTDTVLFSFEYDWRLLRLFVLVSCQINKITYVSLILNFDWMQQLTHNSRTHNFFDSLDFCAKFFIFFYFYLHTMKQSHNTKIKKINGDSITTDQANQLLCSRKSEKKIVHLNKFSLFLFLCFVFFFFTFYRV